MCPLPPLLLGAAAPGQSIDRSVDRSNGRRVHPSRRGAPRRQQNRAPPSLVAVVLERAKGGRRGPACGCGCGVAGWSFRSKGGGSPASRVDMRFITTIDDEGPAGAHHGNTNEFARKAQEGARTEKCLLRLGTHPRPATHSPFDEGVRSGSVAKRGTGAPPRRGQPRSIKGACAAATRKKGRNGCVVPARQSRHRAAAASVQSSRASHDAKPAACPRSPQRTLPARAPSLRSRLGGIDAAVCVKSGGSTLTGWLAVAGRRSWGTPCHDGRSKA